MSLLIAKADTTGKKLTNDYEILVVNDGSKDDTKEILEHLRKKYTKLRLIHHEKNRGYGGALITGFENAKKEWIFYTDGDGQYDPSELLLLTKVLDTKTDVVNGYKLERGDSFIRKALGRTYNLSHRQIFSLPIADVDCDFRLIKRSVLKKTHLTKMSGSICLELIIELQKVGARFKEVGVHHYPRKHGKSQFFTFPNLTKTFYDNIQLIKRNKFL